MTYNAKRWTIEECRNESAYIATINPKFPGRSFNDDPNCFARYCNTQANHVAASGFTLIAHDITQARDIAWPTFRSDRRREGWYVAGVFAAESYDARKVSNTQTQKHGSALK